MKRKIFYSIICMLLPVYVLTAQNNAQAEKIISDLVSMVRINAIKTDFKLSVSEAKSPDSHTGSGSFTLKGNKFMLEMEDMKVWFDGKTQWSYVLQNNEVSITEPTDKELSETNPMAILSGYQSKSVIRFSKSKSDQFHWIEMIPKAKNPEIAKIEVQINKATQNPHSIKLTNKNGSATLLTLSNFKKGVNVPESTFVYNPAKFRGATENDLR